MRKRLNDGILNNLQLAVGEIVRHCHLGDLGDTIEFQDTIRIIQRQVVRTLKRAVTAKGQGPWTNFYFRTCVSQRLSCTNIHG